MENLRPVYPQNNPQKGLSHKEFQELLNSWCHEKGILTELRLQLRFKLFKLLKYTIIGKDIGQRSSQSNLANQAINLIVAEYLLQNKCYYSLSVFNTEAKFTNVLPDYMNNSDEDVQDNELFSLHYNKENFPKIMDLVGLKKSSPYYDKLLSMYFDKQEAKSILDCLITLLCQLSNVNELFSKDFPSLDTSQNETQFIQEIEKLLTRANLPSSYVNKICQYITSFHQMKKERQEKYFLESFNKLKNEITFKDRKIDELNKTTDTLQNQISKMTRSYKKTRTRLDNILFKENNEVKKDIKTDCLPNSNIDNVKICQLQHCNTVCAENKKLTEDLINENLVLKKENREQKEMLKKLFLIYKDLLTKFKNCQNKLNSDAEDGFIEELFSNILFEKNLKTAQLQNDIDASDSSSDSVTEEILHQARVTLQTLEDETKEVEDKFKFYHYT